MVFSSRDLPYSYIAKKKQKDSVSINFEWANEADILSIQKLAAILKKNINIDYKSFKELEKDIPLIFDNSKKQDCLITTIFYHFYHFEQKPEADKILAKIRLKYPYIENIESLRLFVWDYISDHHYGFVRKNQRDLVLNKIGNNLGIKSHILDSILWSDYESEKVLIRYRTIRPEIVIYLYNFHLLETILQNTTSITIFIPDLLGYITKKLIFKLKFTPLFLEINKLTPESKHEDPRLKRVMEHLESAGDIYSLRIAIPKEISAPKMRYGNTLTNIIFYLYQKLQSSNLHFFSTLDLKIKKQNYLWTMSDTFLNSIRYPWNINWGSGKIESFNKYELDLTENLPSDDLGIDSKIEKTFLLQFRDKEWTIKPEPLTIILRDGAIFIPDFVLTNDFTKILVEIIGFWTETYINSKINKLRKYVKEVDHPLVLLIDETLKKHFKNEPELTKFSIIFYNYNHFTRAVNKFHLMLKEKYSGKELYTEQIKKRLDSIIPMIKNKLNEKGIINFKGVQKLLTTEEFRPPVKFIVDSLKNSRIQEKLRENHMRVISNIGIISEHVEKSILSQMRLLLEKNQKNSISNEKIKNKISLSYKIDPLKIIQNMHEFEIKWVNLLKFYIKWKNLPP
ncbi:MAG: DUF790 family protein [Promethearchaeota archaeon]|nr:MAG: DUF790 family protein [Candidatus Lokiarchaeota archaeon]